ncbi:WhiB family transcriptional regulator [Nonomuraea sp. NPDC050153]|uniref:WhiB family transcriptional regulator n=1 Tax=Nonomuraea sp. NPDC050153 TaxID=3364359 RepID=UPI003797FB77
MNDWRSRAACKDVDPDLFFQDTGRPSQRLTRICRGCPVLITCTFDALRRNDLGYQAGLSKQERDRVRRWDRQAKVRAAARTARQGLGEPS